MTEIQMLVHGRQHPDARMLGMSPRSDSKHNDDGHCKWSLGILCPGSIDDRYARQLREVFLLVRHQFGRMKPQMGGTEK
jgi:hypothetical protein